MKPGDKHSGVLNKPFSQRTTWADLGLAAVFLTFTTLAGSIERTEFPILFTVFSIAFIAYILILRSSPGRKMVFWIGIALIGRLVLLFFMPNLSDDAYRFVWDGILSSQGLNPYALTPADYLAQHQFSSIQQELYTSLNSPEYYSVYPPLTQLLFYVTALASEGSVFQMMFLQKLIIVGFEAGTIWLLFRLLRGIKLPAELTFLYALNPLVIVEITGNLHHEGIVVFFILLTFFLGHKTKWIRSGLAIAVAIAVKLVPLILTPFVMRSAGKPGKFLFVGAILVSVVVLLIAPLWWLEAFGGTGASLDLYFRRFEFNASLYYLVRWIGSALVGYNPIAITGPAMAVLSAAGLLFLFLKYKPDDTGKLAGICIMALTWYLFCATTVHPWYIIPLVALAPIGGFRFPIVWSFVVFLSYTAYLTDDFKEVTLLLIIEYLVVFGYVIYEVRYRIPELFSSVKYNS